MFVWDLSITGRDTPGLSSGDGEKDEAALVDDKRKPVPLADN